MGHLRSSMETESELAQQRGTTMERQSKQKYSKPVLLPVLLLAMLAILACGGSASSGATSGGDICRYADKAASYLSRTQDALEGAKSHIGSSTLLQDDIDKLADLARDFENSSTPTGTRELRTRTTSAISAAAGLLEEFQAGRSGESAASYYLTSLEAAVNEVKRVRASNSCP